jgi:CTP:molybdopterin cytidylyltransferase MocA
MDGVLGVILAAGAGRRAGGPKALLRLEGRSFLAHVVERLRRPGIAGLVAVIGHQADEVAAEASAAGVGTVLNARPDEGMLSSILLGLGEAERRGTAGLLLHPVDHPLVAAATVDAVLQAMAAGARVAVPSFEGRRGHPSGWSRAAWDALRAAPPEAGARAVLAAHPDWVVHVPGDAGSRQGVNTAEDYGRLVLLAKGGLDA